MTKDNHQQQTADELREALRKLEKELEKVSKERDYYKFENAQMEFRLEELKRVVPLTKQLAKSADTAARKRIAKLDKVPDRKLPKVFRYDPASPVDELLKATRVYDLETYYTLHQQKPRLTYRVVNGSYSSLSNGFFKLGRHGLAGARKIRSRGMS
ncbi:MAG TPA: hypothetical protein VG604_03480 [Candidatus Saccharimonadales bacterium]|nr:hypothetical protein [Candidatus Saccharimonadales bacterium]